MHRYAERHQIRDSGNRFIGAGVARTPIDEEQEGRLLSLQLGLSHETTFRERFNGTPRDETGGWAFVAHPTLVWATSPHVLLFAMTSLPMAEHWNSPADRERFRVGAGAMVSLGR